MNDNEEIILSLKEEYQNNCQKIDKLSEKIQIIRENSFEYKLIGVFTLSMVPWALIILLLPKIIDIIPTIIIPTLSLTIPMLVGMIGETLLTKKDKSKEKLKMISNAITKKEKIKELTEYQIEKEKLKNKNIILEQMVKKLKEKQKMIETLSSEYILIEKENNSKGKGNLNVKSEFLEEKISRMDIITTKILLKNNFWDVRDKVQKKLSLVGIFIVGGLGLTLSYNLPNLAINNLGVQSKIFGFLGPFLVGGLVCGKYLIRKTKNRFEAFNELNKKLGEEALDETINSKKLKLEKKECFDKELETLINDICIAKLELESQKQKFDDILQISESINSDKLSHDKELVIEETKNFSNMQEELKSTTNLESRPPVLIKKINHFNNKK